MSPQKHPLTEQLVGHDAVIAAAKARVRELEVEQRQVGSQVAALSEEIVEAHAENDTAKASRPSKDRAKLEGDATRTAKERLAGAQRALARVEADRGVFARNNLAELLMEAKPAADAAVAGLRDAIEGLGRARAAWVAQEQRVTTLLRLAGEPAGSTARLPGRVEDLVRDAGRVATDAILAPFPEHNAGLRIVPEDHPDPAISAPARRALKEAA